MNRKSGLNRAKKIVDGCYFFGFEQNIQMAEYLYNTLNAAIYSEIQKFKHSDTYVYATVARKSLSTSFEHGLNVRLGQRLNELKTQMKSEVSSSGKNALVVVKDQAVQSGFDNLSLKLTTQKSAYRIRSGDAFSAGKTAAEKINLQRPLNGKESRCAIA